MKITLSVDAISARPTGIGRYVWELANGIAADPRVKELRCYRDGLFLPSPQACLAERPPRTLVRRFRRWSTVRFGWGLGGALFHGPNFFLPERVEGGIVTIHDLSVLRFPETHPLERVRMFETRFASTLARAGLILTDCETVREELVDWFGLDREKITAVPLGIGPNFRPRPVDEILPVLSKYGIEQRGYLLCVATYEPRKRITAAIDAHRLLAERQAVPPLVLVGASGWKNEELAKRIEDALPGGNLFSLGHVEEEDLPFIYAGAALFLFPSIYEGFGFPPLEAMACGVPAIVSNRSCLPEVTKGAAMLIEPDDMDAFSVAIERGLSDDRWRSQAIEAGQQVARGYTWQRCSEQTINVYRKVWTEYDQIH